MGVLDEIIAAVDKKMDKSSDYGQPENPAFNQKRRIDRGTHELLGICKGILADGRVDESEVIMLSKWLIANKEMRTEWPGIIIFERLNDILKDDVVDEEEKSELFDLLSSLIGSPEIVREYSNMATTLPFDNPPPKVVFNNMNFCFTGKTVYGKRSKCHEEVIARGGIVNKDVVKSLNYLIVGELGSRDWIQTSYGRKIENAISNRDQGSDLSIISEEHWVTFL